MIFLGDTIGTLWFVILSCGISFVAGIALADKMKKLFFGR